MPDVGEGLTEAEILKWYVAAGRHGHGQPDRRARSRRRRRPSSCPPVRRRGRASCWSRPGDDGRRGHVRSSRSDDRAGGGRPPAQRTPSPRVRGSHALACRRGRRRREDRRGRRGRPDRPSGRLRPAPRLGHPPPAHAAAAARHPADRRGATGRRDRTAPPPDASPAPADAAAERRRPRPPAARPPRTAAAAPPLRRRPPRAARPTGAVPLAKPPVRKLAKDLGVDLRDGHRRPAPTASSPARTSQAHVRNGHACRAGRPRGGRPVPGESGETPDPSRASVRPRRRRWWRARSPRRTSRSS